MSIVITVSRQLGSQGSYIAVAVAQELQLRYLDREVLHRTAELAGYPDAEMVARLEEKERVPGLLGSILAALETMPPVPAIPSATLREGYAYDDLVAMLMRRESLTREEAWERLAAEQRRAELSADYPELVRRVILESAQTGDAIIVGRGGQVLLREMPGVLHVQVIASEAVRVHRLMHRMGIDEKEAEQQIRQSDRDRARYLKHFHHVDWRDPCLYDLVINTDKIPGDLAVKMICGAARGLGNLARLP